MKDQHPLWDDQEFPKKNSREFNVFHRYTEEGNNFNICCSNGELVLHILKVIMTVIVRQGPVIDC
jgi:hypothetical protein